MLPVIESLLRIGIALFVLISVLDGTHYTGVYGPVMTMCLKQMMPQPDRRTTTVETDRPVISQNMNPE